MTAKENNVPDDKEGNMREFKARTAASADTRLYHCSIACIESRQKKKSSIIQDIAQHMYQLIERWRNITRHLLLSPYQTWFLFNEEKWREKKKKKSLNVVYVSCQVERKVRCIWLIIHVSLQGWCYASLGETMKNAVAFYGKEAWMHVWMKVLFT